MHTLKIPTMAKSCKKNVLDQISVLQLRKSLKIGQNIACEEKQINNINGLCEYAREKKIYERVCTNLAGALFHEGLDN